MIDESRFAELYRQYSPVIFSRSLAILKNEQDALDATQEIGLKLHKNIRDFEKIEKKVAWIYRVTTNHCLNILKSKKRKHWDRWEEIDVHALSEETEVELGVLTRISLGKIVGRMSKMEKEVFVYYYQHGMTQDEISEVIGKSRITVIRCLDRIRERVHKLGSRL